MTSPPRCPCGQPLVCARGRDELLAAAKAVLNVYFPTDMRGARSHWKVLEAAIALAESHHEASK